MKIKKLLMFMLTATLVFASKPAANVFADEIELSETSASFDAPDEQAQSLGLQEEISADEGSSEDAVLSGSKAETGVITAIDAPKKTDYSFKFKSTYDTLNKELPDTLTVHTGDKTKQIKVRWICEGDYNDKLGKYPFIPDMEGYKLADGVELPKLTLTFEKEVPGGKAGVGKVITDHRFEEEVPIVGSSSASNTTTDLPRKFNSYEDDMLPVVRNQGETGTCWAHSAIGAVEADLIKNQGVSTEVDLSEMHLAYHVYTQYDDPEGCRKDYVTIEGNGDYLNMGGDAEMSTRLLSNMVGAASEEDYPLDSDPGSISPTKEEVTGMDVAQIRNAYYINVKDTNGIKAAIQKHGGVTANLCSDFENYGDAANGSVYCPKPLSDHAVMLVGWDDDFSRDKFNSKSGAKPNGNGAWLVRNSWGDPGYSLDGYLWMSYEDVAFLNDYARICVAFDTSIDTYDHCYAYDGCPLPSSTVKINNEDEIYLSYNVSGKEAVKGVGIELNSQNVMVYVSAYNSKSGQNVEGNIHTSNAGFYTVEFANPLEVYEDSEIELYVYLIADNGDQVKLCVEKPGTEGIVSDEETGSIAYSVAKADGGFYINDKKIKKDARIKLYTNKSNAKPVKVTGVSLNKKSVTLGTGGKLTLTATVKPKNASNLLVTWKSDKPAIASVDEYGNVKAKKPGKAKITATTVDGKKTASCTVTVKKAVKVTGVKLNKKTASVKVGKTIKLKATVSPKNATNKEVTWKSSKSNIASVDKNGKVKGKKKGSTKITVTTKDGKKKASCTVTVK